MGAGWPLGGGHSQASPGEWKSTLLSSHVTSDSATAAPLFTSPGVAEERGRLVSSDQISPSPGYRSPLRRSSPSGEHPHGTHVPPCFCPSERSTHVLLPQTSLSPIFQSCSFGAPDRPAKPLSTVCNHTSGRFSVQA